MRKLWKRLDVIDILSEQNIDSEVQHNNEVSEEERFELIKKIQEFKEGDQNKNGWKQQGIKMFKRKFYEQAVYCFKKAEEPDLTQKAVAYFTADQGANDLGSIEEINSQITQESDAKSRRQANQKIKELK